MRCYKHPKEEAVGMCKVCNKGLCSVCAVERDGFLFCATHGGMEEVVKHVEEEAFAPPARYEEARPAAARAPPPRRAMGARPRPVIPRVRLHGRASTTVTPAMVGGIISGMLMGIPFVNFFCFIWLILGGATAAYFLILKEGAAENVRGSISQPEGMTVGAISGVMGANIAILLNLFAAVNFWDMVVSGIAGLGTNRETANLIFSVIIADPNVDAISLFARYFLMLVSFPIFGAIGGWLVAKYVK